MGSKNNRLIAQAGCRPLTKVQEKLITKLLILLNQAPATVVCQRYMSGFDPFMLSCSCISLLAVIKPNTPRGIFLLCRIDNLIYSPDTTGQVLALLDWELSTLGYPLADLAYSAMCYHFPMSDKTGVRGLPRPLPEGREPPVHLGCCCCCWHVNQANLWLPCGHYCIQVQSSQQCCIALSLSLANSPHVSPSTEAWGYLGSP